MELHAQPGQAIRRSAATETDLRHMMEEARRKRLGTAGPPPEAAATITRPPDCFIMNRTGLDLPRWTPLLAEAAVVSPAAAPSATEAANQYMRLPILSGYRYPTPAVTNQTPIDRFAVLAEPAAPDQIVPAYVSGIVPTPLLNRGSDQAHETQFLAWPYAWPWNNGWRRTDAGFRIVQVEDFGSFNSWAWIDLSSRAGPIVFQPLAQGSHHELSGFLSQHGAGGSSIQPYRTVGTRCRVLHQPYAHGYATGSISSVLVRDNILRAHRLNTSAGIVDYTVCVYNFKALPICNNGLRIGIAVPIGPHYFAVDDDNDDPRNWTNPNDGGHAPYTPGTTPTAGDPGGGIGPIEEPGGPGGEPGGGELGGELGGP